MLSQANAKKYWPTHLEVVSPASQDQRTGEIAREAYAAWRAIRSNGADWNVKRDLQDDSALVKALID
jgi:hypothetical protein